MVSHDRSSPHCSSASGCRWPFALPHYACYSRAQALACAVSPCCGCARLRPLIPRGTPPLVQRPDRSRRHHHTARLARRVSWVGSICASIFLIIVAFTFPLNMIAMVINRESFIGQAATSAVPLVIQFILAGSPSSPASSSTSVASNFYTAALPDRSHANPLRPSHILLHAPHRPTCMRHTASSPKTLPKWRSSADTLQSRCRSNHE